MDNRQQKTQFLRHQKKMRQAPWFPKLIDMRAFQTTANRESPDKAWVLPKLKRQS